MEFADVHVWVLLGISLLALEIVTPGFVVACFGIGALLAGVGSALGLAVPGQVLVFAAGSFGAVFSVRPLVMRLLAGKGPSVKTGVAALVGREGILEKAISGPHAFGEVRVGGESWRASADVAISEGETVRVVGVLGATLKVERP